MDRGQLDSYALLLEENDPDSTDWLTGPEKTPADDRQPISGASLMAG